MNQQPVPAPGFSPSEQAPPPPKTLTLRWGFAALALIVAGGFVFERVWMRSVAPDTPLATARPPVGAPARAEERPPSAPATPVVHSSTPAGGSELEERIEREVAARLEARREQDVGDQAQRALQALRISRLQSAAESAEQDLQTLRTQLEAWNDSVNSLMADDDGRRIAFDPGRVERFAEMLESGLVTDEQVSRWETELDLLLAPLQASGGDGSAARLPEEFTSELNDLRSSVRAARDELQGRRAALNTMIAQAGDDQPGSEAPTLEQVLELRQAEAAHRREALLAEARRQARTEVEQQLAEAEAAREAAEGRVKLLEVQAQKEEAEDVERVLADALVQAARLREEARQKAELIRRFEREWPAMRAYLVPFTTEGFTQPGGHGFERTTEKGPVSFGKLQGRGVLKKEIRSLQALYYITTGNRMNDRDHGAFPSYFGGEADWARKHETIQSIQNFLNEYGTIMVEKGLLAP